MAGNEWTAAEANIRVAELLERARLQGPQVIVDEKGRYFDVFYVSPALAEQDDSSRERGPGGTEGNDGGVKEA